MCDHSAGRSRRRSSRRMRLLVVLGFTFAALLVAAGLGGAEPAVACAPAPQCLTGAAPQAPPYNCDGSRDGQIVWSDGYLWECRNVGGFYRWVPVRQGHTPYIEHPVRDDPVSMGPAGWYRWYVDVPQDPAGTNTLDMSWGDGTPSDEQSVPGGTGMVTLAFDHYYSRILPWEIKATLVQWGTHDYAFFWDPPGT